MKKSVKFSCILLLLCNMMLYTTACSNDDDTVLEEIISEELPEEDPTVEENIPEQEPTDNNSCETGKIYIEANGIVRIDLENSATAPNDWETATAISGFAGEGYLLWTGSDNFSTPGRGVITFPVRITTPGTYQFVWRSRITIGSSNTEHNDSWVRIEGDDFFGEKESTGERVFPRGTGKTPNPEGASRDGWFKSYMNTLNRWFWRSSTNDNDPFNIFATFNSAGTYMVEISGRSNGHAIDQFVLFRTDKTLTQAQTADFSETTCR